MSKRLHLMLPLALAALLIFSACAAPTATPEAQTEAAPTWQMQYDLGMRYLAEGNYREAIIAFTAAIEINPKRADAYMGLADAHIALEDIDAAIDALRQGYDATGDEKLALRAQELEESDMQGETEADSSATDEHKGSAAAYKLFTSPDFVTPEEMTVNGVPFYDAEIEWVISSFGGYSVMESVTNENETGRLVYWIYPGSRSDDWKHGIQICSDLSDSNGSKLSYIYYGGSDYSGFQRMDIVPELRGIAPGDTAEEVLSKLGIGPEERELILSGVYVDIRALSYPDMPYKEMSCMATFYDTPNTDDYTFVYSFAWFYSEEKYVVWLSAYFDDAGLLRSLGYSYDTLKY